MTTEQHIQSIEKEIPIIRAILNARIKKLNELKSTQRYPSQFVDAHGDVIASDEVLQSAEN